MGIFRVAARIRGLFAGNYAENDEQQQIHANNRGDLLVAQALPPLADIVRMGQSWQVKTSSATAALTTEPTTVALLSLFNNESATGKSYVIDSVAMWERVVDATQQNELALFVMNSKRSTTSTPPTDAALTIRSLAGRTYDGAARTLVGATVVDEGWFPAGISAPGASAVAGGAWRVHDVNLRGMYIVPPNGYFHVSAAKIAATASQLHVVIRWHEVQLNWRT